MSRYRRPGVLKGSTDQKVEQLRRDLIALIDELERDENARAGAEKKKREAEKK